MARSTTANIIVRFFVYALILSVALNALHLIWQYKSEVNRNINSKINSHGEYSDMPENMNRKGKIKTKNKGRGAIVTPKPENNDSAKRKLDARTLARNNIEDDEDDNERNHENAPPPPPPRKSSQTADSNIHQSELVAVDDTSTARHTEIETKTDTSIRKWGCDLTETPLIFVHNGKSGGGNIRTRLAVSAQNYTREQRWTQTFSDNHFYPIATVSDQSNNNNNNTATIRRGRFCNSLYPHYVSTPHIETPLVSSNFEGNVNCNATTPLGIAVACHHPSRGKRRGGINHAHYKNQLCQNCDDDYYLDIEYYFGDRPRRIEKNDAAFLPLPDTVFDPRHDPPPGTTCDIVFTAHNNLGSELNWLPPRYLKEHWWDNSEYGTHTSASASINSNSNSEPLERYWERLLDDRHRRRKKLEQRAKGEAIVTTDSDSDTSHRWCPEGFTSKKTTIQYHDRPQNRNEYKQAYSTCGRSLAEEADRAFLDTFFHDHNKPKNFSPFYASMPLHRITVMRDPWAWIISKFFWHNLFKENPDLRCHNVGVAVFAKGGDKIPLDPFTGREIGWVEGFSLAYLIKLCGNDCRVRYENAMMTLEEIEAQVASNLRNAFSVVGLLHEEASFYDMITDRIQYVDLGLNLDISGQSHSTTKTPENLRCKKLFGSDETFRESVRQEVPAFAALERMYFLGIEVNSFQKEELKQCRLDKGEQPTNNSYDRQEKRQRKAEKIPKKQFQSRRDRREQN